MGDTVGVGVGRGVAVGVGLGWGVCVGSGVLAATTRVCRWGSLRRGDAFRLYGLGRFLGPAGPHKEAQQSQQDGAPAFQVHRLTVLW